MNQIPMTERGAQLLRDELKRLKTVERPRIVEAIADAREHGDLKENAEYHAAREQQGFCEGRIQEIESKLSNAQIIDVTKELITFIWRVNFLMNKSIDKIYSVYILLMEESLENGP